MVRLRRSAELSVGVIFLGGRGRGTFGSSALLRGTETSGSGVEIGLSGSGLPLSFLGAGQSSSSGSLSCACFLVACSVSGRLGGVIVARSHGARPGGRARSSAGEVGRAYSGASSGRRKPSLVIP